jgi:hypothetical protein
MRTYPHPSPAPAARQHLRIAVYVLVNGKFVEDDCSKNIMCLGTGGTLSLGNGFCRVYIYVRARTYIFNYNLIFFEINNL